MYCYAVVRLPLPGILERVELKDSNLPDVTQAGPSTNTISSSTNDRSTKKPNSTIGDTNPGAEAMQQGSAVLLPASEHRLLSTASKSSQDQDSQYNPLVTKLQMSASRSSINYDIPKTLSSDEQKIATTSFISMTSNTSDVHLKSSLTASSLANSVDKKKKT